jgi:hypothetical protein
MADNTAFDPDRGIVDRGGVCFGNQARPYDG